MDWKFLGQPLYGNIKVFIRLLPVNMLACSAQFFLLKQHLAQEDVSQSYNAAAFCVEVHKGWK
jgi:hypothetical protein